MNYRLKDKEVELDDEQIAALKIIIDGFEEEDRTVRERQIRMWKHLWFLWEGFQNTYWDSVAHDWRIFGLENNGSGSGGDDQSGYYDKNINVFRAFLEIIIAALSVTVPPVKCIPDDADSDIDVQTAKAGTKIGDLVYNHNDAPLLWVRGLWTYCLQGMVAAYNYTVEDSEYGEVSVEQYKNEEEEQEVKICPNCKKVLSEPEVAESERIAGDEVDEYDPGDDDIKLHDDLNEGQLMCPQCQIAVDPELQKHKFIVKRLTGTTKQPKARQKIDVNGGLFVKVPNWARSQKEFPYLIYSYETHYTNILSQYPELREKMKDLNTNVSSPDGNQLYERWGRLSPEYCGEYPLNTPTVRNVWLRPCAFNALTDDDMMEWFKKYFPDGAYAVLINDEFACIRNENLDDHWTVTVNPMANYVHFDPIGMLLVSIQEITSELISLELQTIEHSIPQVFADPTVLNFEQYGKTEVEPGNVYPAKNKTGKSLSEGFYVVQTATVSPELNQFGSKINELGQFTSGALPSLSGGSQQNSSRTASQYAMSRNQAVQRLQVHWKIFNYWWKNIFAKVIPAYIKTMVEDERVVTEQGKDNFVNILIKRAELEGKIGDIKLECTENLPQTLDQLKDTVMQLLQGNNPEILAAIGAPENLELLREVLGMNNFTIPGGNDRDKQYEEISELLRGNPVPSGVGPTGQPIEQPSVLPELMVDNHQIEAEICRNWLVSEYGRQAKIEKPEGYKNVLLHLQAHIDMLRMLTQGQPQVQPNQAQEQPKKPELRPVGAQ